jgi:enamidase
MLMAQVASMTNVPPEQVVAMATGNAARHFSRFVGMNRGIIEPGREADIVITDKPHGSAAKDFLDALKHGDVCAPALVMVDGRVVAIKGRDYQFTQRAVKINGDEKDLSTYGPNVEEYLFGPPAPRYHKWIL